MDRPWANGLSRLLAERHLKKGALAELAGVRPGTISAVANSPTAPDISTLQRLADGFTAFDRRGNPTAPAVDLWHFFVSDEQAALLREAAQKQQQLVRHEDLAAVVIRQLAPAVAAAVTAAVSGLGHAEETPAIETDGSTRSDEHHADGKPRRSRRAS